MTDPAANKPTGPLRVIFTLPPGWVEVPRADERPRGLLRRDPFEMLAQQFVASGAVIAPLAGATRDWLRRMSQGAPDALGFACFVEAPNREQHAFGHLAVMGPVRVPRRADGAVDWDDVARIAAKVQEPGSEMTVKRAQLPLGPALETAQLRPANPESPDEKKYQVTYWVVSESLGTMLTMQGGVSLLGMEGMSRLVADITSLAATLRVWLG